MPSRRGFSRPPRILIASNQDHSLQELESFLSRHGYAVHRLYAGAPVLEQARTVRPDVIVLDVKLADRPSFDLSRTLHDDPLIGVSTPILLLVTGHPRRQDRLAALRAGIWELLPRPLDANESLVKFDAYVRAKLDADRVPKQTLVDDTTSLYTTEGLALRARELILQASRHNTSVACVAFAPVLAVEPETAGPRGSVGAGLVRRAVDLLKATGRHSDAIGRLGPVEFAVVAPGTNGVGAVKLAERFRHAAHAGTTGDADAGPGFELRAGYEVVGNVRYTPIEPKDLLGRAARALQLARAEGKWIRASGERP